MLVPGLVRCFEATAYTVSNPHTRGSELSEPEEFDTDLNHFDENSQSLEVFKVNGFQ
jgi:hypothetical protein